MTITSLKSAFVETSATTIALSKMFDVTAGNANPAYLVVTTLDRNEYTAGATGATGTLTGNGHSLGMRSIGGDARGAGIVFTYQPSTGQYYNATYGDLSQLTYTCSGSLGDVTDLSLFGTGNLQLANADAASAYGMMQSDAAGYLATATVVTQTSLTGAVPAQATPDGIANAARNLIGQPCNDEGCWVLANTIASDAGTALPMQSTLIGLAGHANGEWIVAFNGPAGQTGNWQSLVKAGEMVVIGTPGGGGHITTCVSGSGSSAMLVDNITYVNGNGQVLNSAHDGAASDVVIETGHAASVEWAGVQASSVVIYELDTPVVTDTVASAKLATGASLALKSLFAATDPAGHAITEWQVYNSAAGDALVSGGTDHFGDTNSTKVLTTDSLGSVSLLAGANATTDTLEVRAYNGTDWGDWQSLAVAVSKPAVHAEVSVPAAVAVNTPAQAPYGNFSAPEAAGEVVTDGRMPKELLPPPTIGAGVGLSVQFAAFEVSGPDVKSWMQFNPTTGELSGTPPADFAGKVELAVIVTSPRDIGGIDLISIAFTPGGGQSEPTPVIGMPGMAALYNPPEPGHMLAFHS